MVKDKDRQRDGIHLRLRLERDRAALRLASVALLLLALRFGEPGIARAEEPRTGASVPAVAASPSASDLGPPSPFLGGVPPGGPTDETLRLSMMEAIDRGLKYNLGLLLSENASRAAQGTRWRALGDLLPNVSAHVSGTRQQINLAALGFPGLPGVPEIIGPFNVFDARIFLSQSIFNLNAIYNARAESDNLKAAQYTYRDARDVVVLVCANLYLQAVAGTSRVEAARAQVKTAKVLYDQAVDLKKAGVVPSIDVLRSQVEFQAQEQRLIFLENEFAKQKLSLARAIGLPVGQRLELTDRIPYSPLPPMTPDEALQRAYRSRSDYQGALALVEAAASAGKAARGERFPSLELRGDYGDIGRTVDSARVTFSVGVELKIPIFQGGSTHGKILQADALLRQRKDELEDLRSRIDYEIQSAILDLNASEKQVQVAKSTLDLANEQMKQAQDRFSAGVVNSIEVVQAQDVVAVATENYISSLYAFNIAKASLGRAMGVGEESVREFLGGTH